jgi:hypothetical protein
MLDSEVVGTPKPVTGDTIQVPDLAGFISNNGGIHYTDKTTISVAVSYTEIAIATGVANYILNPVNDTLTEIADPDLPACRSVVYIDGRFVWVTADGESIFYSDVNNASSVQALSFFDAESRPDKNVEAVVLGNDLYILGETSIERFRTTGNSTAPFQRVNNSVISIGYLGGLVDLGDSVMFIGQYKGGTVEIYELSGSQILQRASGIVSEVLNSRWVDILGGGLSGLKGCMSQSWADKGCRIVSFAVQAGQTPYYDICFGYVRDSSGRDSWCLLSDNPKNISINYRDWGRFPIFTQDNRVYGHRFTFVNAIKYKGAYVFQRQAGLLGASGVYNKKFTDQEAGFDFSDEKETVSKGFITFFEDARSMDVELNSLELSYTSYHNTSPAYTTAPITATLSVSTTGLNNNSSFTLSEDFSTPTNKEGDKLKITKTGGIITSNTGWIGLIVETISDEDIEFHRVIANG